MMYLRPLMYTLAALLIGASSDAHEHQQGPVLLTVSVPNSTQTDPQADPQEIRLDRETLMGFPATTYYTTTIWTDGPQKFTGVLIKTLLDELGQPVRAITAHALNDYFALIPQEDITLSGALIAYSRNDTPMPVRDNGPLWIVYPFDDDDTFVTEQHFTRSVWQLTHINIID